MWNGKDPILKERLFGLTNSEGNHGEDVKEYYFYLDSTPTHSYMKYLYKYPQLAFPYDDLVATNRKRSQRDAEYELLDTGIFNEDRYFDVFVEYAKESAEDILVKISIYNRGPEAASLHVLPTLWFRNNWSWSKGTVKPVLRKAESATGASVVAASHPDLGERFLYCENNPPLLFTENETNTERLFNKPNASPYVKDGFGHYVLHEETSAVNPAQTGTKAAPHYRVTVQPGQCEVIRLRLNNLAPATLSTAYRATKGNIFGAAFDTIVKNRLTEAEEFYAKVIPSNLNSDAASVMRQALSGMLWTKQFYFFDVDKWLEEHGVVPFKTKIGTMRNGHWHHMFNADIISMPDKWEYPWYAAWDLAFHILSLSLVDEDFAKQQLDLMLQGRYLHPNGQLPAYEWNFSDVNPPVHAWATIFTYRLEKAKRGVGDIDWLERSFQKLLLNFTWWVNRKDREGKNAFDGGFLGLDNIGVFDRSAPLPTGGYLEQADGTAWMAIFSQNMLEIASQLAFERPAYMEMCLKFVEHFLWIASAIVHGGDDTGMWDEEDGFFYDVLRLPDGSSQRLKVRSMVGLLPLCAVTVFEPGLMEKHPELRERFRKFLAARPELTAFIHDPTKRGKSGRLLGSVLMKTNFAVCSLKCSTLTSFLVPTAFARYLAFTPNIRTY